MELEDIVGDDRPSGSGGAHTSSAMSRFSGYLMTAAVLVIALALLGSVALLAFETHQVADLRAIHADELHVERLVWDGNSTSSSASSSSNDVEAPVEVDVDAPTPTLTPTPTPSDASEPAPSPDPFDIAECSSCGDRDSELLFYTFLDSLQGFKSFVNVYTNVWDLLLFDVPMSMFGKPFLLDASYHFGDATTFLYHMPASDTAYDVFYFLLSQDRRHVLICLPQLDIRTTDQEDFVAQEEGAWAGCINALPVEWQHNDRVTNETRFLIDMSSVVLERGWFVYDTSSVVRDERDLPPAIVSLSAYQRNINMVATYYESPAPSLVQEVAIHFTMSLLPDEPMQPRVADDRVGYFQTVFQDIGTHQPHSQYLSVASTDRRVAYVHKWRLERRADGSVVQPITYYIDPSVPETWRPFLKQGVEAWNVAFERLGFRGAVRAVLPTDAEWPLDYDAGDIRYSSISWAMSVFETYALGPSTVDPRTGEILNADIVFTDGWVRIYLAEFQQRGSVGPELEASSAASARRRAARAALHQTPVSASRAKARKAAAASLAFDRTTLLARQRPSSDAAAAASMPLIDHELVMSLNRSLLASASRLAPAKPIQPLEHDAHDAMPHTTQGLEMNTFHERLKCQHMRMHTHPHQSDSWLLQLHAAEVERAKRRSTDDGPSLDYWRVPTDVIGAGLRDTTMHEVGHTLGLRHNFKATSRTPFERLHDTAYTSRFGISTSVMDYYPTNFAANPAMQGEYFQSVIGEYDKWAIEYGYTLIDNEVPEIQHAVLKEIASRGATSDDSSSASDHSALPHLVYSTDDDVADPNGEDPFTNYWDLGSDPLSFYESRIELVENLLPSIIERTVRVGDDWTPLYRAQSSLMGAMEGAGSYATKFIGGRVLSKSHRGDPNAPLPVTSVPAATQQRALELVCAILTDDLLLNSTLAPAVNMMLVRRAPCTGSISSYCDGMASGGLVERFYLLQQRLIDWLLSPARLRRIYENWRYVVPDPAAASPPPSATTNGTAELQEPAATPSQQDNAPTPDDEEPGEEVPLPSLPVPSISWLLDTISQAIVAPSGPQYDTIKVYYIDKLIALSATLGSPLQVEIAAHLFYIQVELLSKPTGTNYFLQVKISSITRRSPAFS